MHLAIVRLGVVFFFVLGLSARALAAAPSATTTAATFLTPSSAVLNGTGTPAGEPTTGWFRYSTTHPGSCDDTFGTRVPTTGGTDLGNGVAAVAYGITVTGLTSGQTYYYCAIVGNASGKAFGSIFSFTVPGTPVVTTTGSTNVSSSGATLQGSANPVAASTTGYFRYSTTNPGTCNDTFGTRAPTSGGSNLGSGTTSVAYTFNVSGLAPATTYYFCALATNAHGTSVGAVSSFTTAPNPPAVSTSSASMLTGTSAQLNGSANPGGAATTGWFRYDTSSPGTCNDTFGTRAPTTGGDSLGSGATSTSFSQAIAGLTPGITYYYCAIAENAVGKSFGSVVSFTTPAAPTVTTGGVTSLTSTSASLHGTVVANGSSTTAWFRYSTTDPGTCNDTFGSATSTVSGGSGSSTVNISRSVSGLSSGATYYYCAIAENAEGKSFGTVQSFTTLASPTVTTDPATAVAPTGATLNGTVDPNGNTTTGWFRYSTSAPATCNDSFGTKTTTSSLGSGTSPVALTRAIAGLLPGATYYYCAIASNSYGTSFGAVLSFTTPAAAPSVVTNSASLLTGTTAQLNGSANPGGAATTAWFRYDTVSPGTCNDTFGTRAPTSGGDSLGSGHSSVAFSEGITGLTPGTTYYTCAIAENSAGKSFGSVVTFTTPLPPVVATVSATSIAATSASLNGSVTSNGASTTLWFRYATTAPPSCNDTFGSATATTSASAGATNQSFSRSASGLSPGTTYYYCAIAENAEGKSFGAVLSFTTLSSPTVVTDPATSITSNGATLNATVNPNGNSTAGWFRYATSAPPTCNDTFGTKTSTSGLGSTTSNVALTRAISGLLPGTTYYYCAIANNSYGTSFGAVLSFTTPAAAPTVSTSSASLLTGTTAQLNGSANPRGAATTGWFRYATASPGTCNDTFGTRAPTTGGDSLGSGNSSVAFSEGITGLTPGTTYYVCAIAENAAGKSFGSVVTFTTPLPPTVTTVSAGSLTATSASLSGSVTSNGATTTMWFRYATSAPPSCNDTFGSATATTAASASATNLSFSRSASGLSPGTTYYYCAIAENSEGIAFGAVLSFTTLSSPTVVTDAATSIAPTTAVLNATVNPNGNSTSGWFRYATSAPATCNDSFGTKTVNSSLGSTTSNVALTRSIAGLVPGTTYYYCAIASNSYGTSFGSVLSFNTPPALPTVSTNSATMLTGTTAQLRGSANPGGAATDGWFRYATTSPGTCNDTFGTRAPAMGGSSLGSGNSYVSFSENISSLTPGTTYYYCAIAENSAGKSFGSVVTFTTPLPPAVATVSATSISASSATLNGSVTSNGASTTMWFRYAATAPPSCNDSFGSATATTTASASAINLAFSRSASGLSAGTTYYYCAIAENSEGIAFGAVLSFTTPAEPTVTTDPATSITANSATLEGTVNPNGASSLGWFRYATSAPPTCNDSFGTKTANSSLGSGTTPLGYTRAIAGLLPGTTYYYCAIASNSYGTSFGSVLSFTTPAALPAVSTSTANMLTGTTAQLRGSANPGGAATDGWFRYATTSPGTCNDTFGTRAPAMGGSSLGSGNSYVSFTEAISSLTPGTTYYYCAIAENAAGKSFGSVVSFTTPLPPAVTTLAVSSLTSTSATMTGSGIPNGSATTAWFRYAATDPGTCDDTFGSRAPVSGGTSLGSGTSSVGFSRSISGLSPGITYFYCAIAESAEGKVFGDVLSFTTLAPPTVTTTAATLVTPTSASLNGTANPNGASTSGWFRYSTAHPGVCNNTFGTATSSISVGSGTAVDDFTRPTSTLLPGTTYFFCAIAQNSYGISYGQVLSFTTPAAVPNVSTNSVSQLSSTSAQLNGSANPGGAATTGWFRYSTVSPGTCNDSFGTRAPVSGGANLGSGTSFTAFSESIAGLTPGTTYYYCAIAENAAGKGMGTVQTFTTPQPPAVFTLAATPVTATSATLNATAVPNGFSSTGWFRYDTTNPGTCNDSFGIRAPASGGTSLGSGASGVSYSRNLTGLTPGTTYYFCAIASSSVGTGFGGILSFTTPPLPPNVTTLAASNIASTSAVLNGSANPNGSASTGWFRYSTTDPGACNDSFGTRTPAMGGSPLGAGNTSVAFSETITGLTNGVTYYYCAIASNSLGTSFGPVLAFNTAAPTVTTDPATAVSSSGATLNGTANPNTTASTGWFRYSTTDPGTCDDAFGIRAPVSGGTALGAGASPVAFTETIGGLAPATTYYYCAIAESSSGTGFGAVLSFTTAGPPTVTTEPVSALTSTSATLEGTASPNLAAATGWFRYATSDPGTCNDTFGTRAPAVGGEALGNGGSAVPYAQIVSGLAPGTTYYYCAIASNAVGKSFGSVASFTTPAAPAVVTLAASAVTSTSASLEATGAPNGTSATGWFRFDTVDPGSCNDSFGTRAPATGGPALGSGFAPVAFSQAVSGLSPGTTYYYCAVVSSTVGTSFGAVLSFTTTDAPSVATSAASAVSSTTATLEGMGNPNLAATIGWFRYDTVDPGSCNDSFGTRAPVTGGTALGSGNAALPFDESLTGLSPSTTYYFCAIAQNAVGTSFGAVLSFTTTAAPDVTTEPATLVSATGATLNGSANPKLAAATGWFRFDTVDPGSCNDSFGTRMPATGGTSLGSGSSPVSYDETLSGLSPGATYYFCAIAENANGTAFGQVLSFTTPAAPTVMTAPVTALSSTGVTLNGSADPNLESATGWFRYDTVDPGGCNDTFGTRAPATGGAALGSGSNPVAYAEIVTGLSPGTTYYVCAIAENAVGTGFGQVLSFTTPAGPSVVTVAATNVTSTSATLEGSAVPNLSAATGWFRYDTTDPGACNDTFGTRAPTTGGAALGAGSSAVSYSQALAGLSPGTTYYFCAIAENAIDVGFGAVMSFTTPDAPAVTTNAATAVTASGATLQGAANPNLAEATGWFRYDTVDPGTCNDTFGTRAPATGGTALGNGAAAVAFTETIGSLAGGTTYYFCAIAQNDVGTSFGAVMAFTTPAAPTVTTLPASPVASTTALLNGTANPSFSEATGWFRYDTVDPGSCNDTFGTMIPAGGVALGSGSSPVAFAQMAVGLTPDTTYYYCAIASNGVGTSFGTVVSFTTSAAEAPIVTTEPATAITADGATLEGTINPNGIATTAWFRYDTVDPGACDDTFGTAAPATALDVGNGLTVDPFSEGITGLEPATTYYYCAIAQNSAGLAFGAIVTFTTAPAPPEVTTLAATNVDIDTADINGSAIPHGEATTAWFRWDTTDPGVCDDTFGTATASFTLGDGVDPVAFSETITGLTPTTVYYYCAIAENAEGIAFGEILTFSPGAVAPVVTTEPAIDVLATEATLVGTANPNALPTTGWFRFGDQDPGTCSDAFGQRLPADESFDLGSGTAAISFSELAVELEPNFTYYYCAAAENLGGAAFGEVLSFTTPAEPPVVTTVSAELGGTGALIFSGEADPRGAETTAWFRYDTVDPGSCNDTFGTRVPADGIALGDGRTVVPFEESVALPRDTYYVCAIAENEAGVAFGEIVVLELSKGGSPPSEEPPAEDAGCGCRVGPTRTSPILGLGPLLLLALHLRRRRNRKAARGPAPRPRA